MDLLELLEDSYEVFEKRLNERFDDINYKIDKIDEVDSTIGKIGTTLTSSKKLRSKKRKELFDKKVLAEKGDIIGVDRKDYGVPYKHYGIYIGNNEVIHYTSDNLFNKNTISRTSMDKFMNANDKYFILDCENGSKSQYMMPSNIVLSNIKSGFGIGMPTKLRKLIEIYSPEEIVIRAKKCIGEGQYNLAFRNCEHFAIWCKTGINHSYQVERFLKVLNKKWINCR